MWIFSIVFILFYIPVSILIGRWHRNTQLSTELTIGLEQNQNFATFTKILLDVQTGKATKEEISEIRKMLVNIENNK